MFRAEPEIACGDARRGVEHALLDQPIVSLDIVTFAVPKVEQDQERVATSRQKATPRRNSVDPQLQ